MTALTYKYKMRLAILVYQEQYKIHTMKETKRNG